MKIIKLRPSFPTDEVAERLVVYARNGEDAKSATRYTKYHSATPKCSRG